MLTTINLSESNRWDALVKSFCNYDVYYLSGYSAACQLNDEGEPTLIYFENEKFKAIKVVFMRDISQNDKFIHELPPDNHYDTTSPYGYGGFLLEGDVTDAGLADLFDEYHDYCTKHNIVADFVRLHPLLQNHDWYKGAYEVSENRETICMDLESEDVIWRNMKPSSRNRINKIKKLNIEITRDSSKESLRHFMDLYYKTMDKNKADESYYFTNEYFSRLLDMKDSSQIFNAVLEGEIVSSIVVLIGKDFIHYHLGATDPRFYELSPNNLLFYEVAVWGSENGFKGFHLGGGHSSAHDGLFRFKKSLNRNGAVKFYIGKKIWNADLYRVLTDLRKEDEDFDVNTPFFPVYRA